jgi:IS1 family transposase
MRSGFAFLLIVAVLFGAGYWYLVAEAVCDVPVSYRIGTIDPRFGISEEEVRNVVSEAESMWEDSTGENLFTYDTDGSLIINFVFDERQETANEQVQLEDVLESKEAMSDTIRTQYETLMREYESLRATYESQTTAYEQRLTAYNTEVNDWNEQGGAPADVYDRLEATKRELSREQERLNAGAAKLNVLVRKMNTLSAKGNSLISDYNETVEVYNGRFSEGHEFTQGDYEQDIINVYQYDSREELVLVLAHEFGHALSLDHVEGPESIMHKLMGEQTKESGLSETDIAEFERVCGDQASFLSVFYGMVFGR